MAAIKPAHRHLDPPLARGAFEELDARMSVPVTLILGGGTAMLLAHGYSDATPNLDAFPIGVELSTIAEQARKVATVLDLEPDWLNPWFTTFTHVLPSDYKKRLVRVFEGKNLVVDALGAEDLLVMKCFAGRDKDRPHAVKLLKIAKDLTIVDARISELMDKRVPGAEKAADFFDDLRERLGL